MAREMFFRIENAAVTQVSVPLMVDGDEYLAMTSRNVIEAIAEDRAGKTLSLPLPADSADEFPEGTRIKITIEAVADAAYLDTPLFDRTSDEAKKD